MTREIFLERARISATAAKLFAVYARSVSDLIELRRFMYLADALLAAVDPPPVVIPTTTLPDDAFVDKAGA